ncbi:hypothetical protein K8T06_04980 [bacterium]|nr:hypothetical protein [bacterium]
MIKRSLILAFMILAVTLCIGLIGCGDAGGEANTKAPIRLSISSLNGGDPLQASIVDLLEEEITCTVKNQTIDPNYDATSYYMDVICKGYEVSYFRKDSGSRVPATFTGSINAVCEVNGEIGIPIVICRASQKEMPPLKDLCDPGYDQETGLFEIHTTCRIVVWGETFAGEEVVTDPGHMIVNFACLWVTL